MYSHDSITEQYRRLITDMIEDRLFDDHAEFFEISTRIYQVE